jgi:N-acetylglucosamine-6-phosphate deacetylase
MSRFRVQGELLIQSQLHSGMVCVEDGQIARVSLLDAWLPDEWRDCPIHAAAYVAPGFIDLQVNGGFGIEVGDDPEAIRLLARRLPETGVTAFLPTIVTSPSNFYPKTIAAFEAAKGAPGARPLGLHMEGPFLSPNRKGAHRRDLIEHADPRLIDLFLASDAVRLVTLAPERPDALAMIRRLSDADILVSLGHTDATYEEFLAGLDAGARMATHLYNAMSPFSHRAPGAIGAALADDRVSIGLIADGVHSHPASVKLAYAMKRAGKMVLVSDMMSAAGMPPGEYALGGQEVVVDGTSARLADGTLAGSLLTMDQAVRNIIAWTGADNASALSLASEHPAHLLGMAGIGCIHEGRDADLVLLGADLRVEMTIVRGEIVYRREAT